MGFVLRYVDRRTGYNCVDATPRDLEGAYHRKMHLVLENKAVPSTIQILSEEQYELEGDSVYDDYDDYDGDDG